MEWAAQYARHVKSVKTLKDVLRGMHEPPDEAWLRSVLGPLTEYGGLRFARAVSLEHLFGAEPEGAGAFRFDHVRLPVSFGCGGDEEQSVEPPLGVETRHPARVRSKQLGAEG